MIKTLPFNEHVAEYEAWFDEYPMVFRSELAAIRELLPQGSDLRGLEVATGTGRFAAELGIAEAVEPAPNMRARAIKRGINVRDAEAESLPYHDLSFDYLLMSFCISYFESLALAFKEANRVLKNGGSLIVGFIDKDSILGKEYESRRDTTLFYKEAIFYAPEKILSELKRAGFKKFQTVQTLFNSLADTKEVELPKAGFGSGSFVVIKAIK